MSRVHVIHENGEWVAPLRRAFDEQGVPYTEWFMDGGTLDLSRAPPPGVFYNRMSASSHTRGHRFAAEFTAPLLAWLRAHGRRVVNGPRALQLEISKLEQYLALHAVGVPVPRTLAASGDAQVIEAAHALGQAPFIFKPNRGGKGLGVRLFDSVAALESHLATHPERSLDGIELLQEYICPADKVISRMEFIGGAFFYRVEVDTSDGFELCPADECAVGDTFCPAPGEQQPGKFRLADSPTDAGLVDKLEHFFAANDAEIAAAEYVEDAAGRRFVYDVNMNTNYNRQAEQDAGNSLRGMHRVAEFLGAELRRTTA